MPVPNITRAILLQECLGLVTSIPAWRLPPNALADCVNMRFRDGLLVPIDGAGSQCSFSVPGTYVRGFDCGQTSANSTEAIIVTEKGAFYNTLTSAVSCISLRPQTGYVYAMYGNNRNVSGSGTRWLSDVDAGDLFYMYADGSAYGVEVSAVVSNTHIVLKNSYAGGATSGQYIIGKQFSSRTQVRKWCNAWFFVDPSSKPFMWDVANSVFRPVGIPQASALGSAYTGTGTAGMDAGAYYSYKIAYRALFGSNYFVGNASSAVTTQQATGTAREVCLSGFPAPPTWVSYYDVYRTEGLETSAELSLAEHYYLTSLPVSTYVGGVWYDRNGDSVLDLTTPAPVGHDAPPSGVEWMEVHGDRAVWFKGSSCWVGGLEPTNPHTGSRLGRWEPDYCPLWRMSTIGYGTSAIPDFCGAFRVRGKLYALCQNSVWRLEDGLDSPAAWHWRLVAEGIGGASKWLVFSDGSSAFWVGYRFGEAEVFRFDGASFENIGDPVKNLVNTYIIQHDMVNKGWICSSGKQLILCGAGIGLLLSFDSGFEWPTWSRVELPEDVTAYGGSNMLNRLYGLVKAGGSYHIVLWSSANNGIAGYAYPSYEIITAPVKAGGDVPLMERMWKLYRWLHTEISGISGTATISGWRSVDRGSWTALSCWPVTCSTNQLRFIAHDISPEAWGHGLQLRFRSTGSAAWSMGPLWVAMQVDLTREVD